MDGPPVLQLVGIDPSLLVSGLSVLISLGVLTIYALQYRQQERQLDEQHRQLRNQEAQLETQKEQLEKQERQLERYDRELAELERQTELAELAHQAHVEVEDYEFEGDRVIVLLSNYGNGAATDLRLETCLHADGSEHTRQRPGESRLRRRDGNGDHPYEGQALRPGEQRVEFEGEAIVALEGPTGSVHQQSLRGVLLDLREERADLTPSVSFRVLAQTLTQEEHAVDVTERPLSLSVPEGAASFSLATAADRMARL